jgi:hypothetical protein
LTRYTENSTAMEATIGPLLDAITIPPPLSSSSSYQTTIQSSLNGSIGQDWSYYLQPATDENAQVICFECHILRGISQTKWVRNPYYHYTGHSIASTSNSVPSIAVNPLVVSVIRPPKAPYDQLPTHCIYRGEVIDDKIIRGKVYTTSSNGNNQEKNMRCIGIFEMYKL